MRTNASDTSSSNKLKIAARMIRVRLCANPGAFDRHYGPGAFETYYSTANQGRHVHVTKHHHKCDLNRVYGGGRVFERHIAVKSANVLDAILAGGAFRSRHHILDLAKHSDETLVIHGRVSRDLDLAVGFVRGLDEAAQKIR